jgi:hypothetical protein
MKGNVKKMARDLGDKSSVGLRDFKALEAFAAKFDIVLSPEQRAAILLRNNESSKTCYGWMQHFFELVGDSVPNKYGEIHLEPVDVVDIFLEYQRDLLDAVTEMKPLCYSAFCEVWKSCFPHVKIRAYKAVCGKCVTSACLFIF